MGWHRYCKQDGAGACAGMGQMLRIGACRRVLHESRSARARFAAAPSMTVDVYRPERL
jgi:hypothetical protein